MKVKIADLIPQPRAIPVGEKSLEVRGLTLQEIVTLLTKHKDALLGFLGDNQNFDGLVITAPELVAEIISIAADCKDEIDDVKRLPFSIQVDALMAVWELSVPDLKKLTESLSKLAATLERSQKGN